MFGLGGMNWYEYDDTIFEENPIVFAVSSFVGNAVSFLRNTSLRGIDRNPRTTG